MDGWNQGFNINATDATKTANMPGSSLGKFTKFIESVKKSLDRLTDTTKEGKIVRFDDYEELNKWVDCA